MIKKLRRRYLITNMILLSSTLLIALAILFGMLYHSQVESSYSTMNEMLEEFQPPPAKRDKPEPKPNSYDGDQPVVVGLNYNPEDNDGQQQGNQQCPDEWHWVEKSYGAYPEWQPPSYWGLDDPEKAAEWWRNWQAFMDWQNQQFQQNQQNQQNSGENPQNNDQNNQNNQFGNPYQNGGWWGGGQGQPPQDQQQQQQPAQSEQRPPEDSQKPAQSETPRTERKRTEPRRDQQSKPETSKTSASVSSETKTESVTTESEITKTTAATTKKTTASTEKSQTTKTTPETTVMSMETTVKTTTTEPVIHMEEGQYIPDAFVARVDDDGNIESYSGNGDPKPDDDHFDHVNHAMDSIRKRGNESGTIQVDDVPYRYLYQQDSSGIYRLVLLNRTLEISTLTKMLVLFGILAVIGLIAMFALSSMLANWTVTPIATAWEKQKQFVADASHELKTPLAVIAANTDVILSDQTQIVQEQSKWLSYIKAETKRMNKLITNLLTVARMDQKNKVTETTEILQLSETVRNVCLVFEPVIYEHGKTLNTVIQRNVRIPADEDNIKQFLSILLDNAILHSVPKADITVSLSKDTQNKVRLAVSNTAEDIPPEQLAHLFDRFFRLDTEGSPNGSGLGLSIAKSIVHQLGGTLTVTSENRLVTFVATFSS